MPAGPWPDGRDPLPGVIDVDALGPMRRTAPLAARHEAPAPAPERVPEPVPEPELIAKPELIAEPPTPDDDNWLALPDDMWDVAADDPYRRLFDEPIEPEPVAPPPQPAPEPRPVRLPVAPTAVHAAIAAPPPPPPPRRDVSLASAALVMAFVVLLTGVLSAATGLADDEGDDVATSEETTTTVGGDTTSTSGFVATIPSGPTSTTGTTSVPSSGVPTPTTTGPRITIPDRSTPTTRAPSTTTQPTQPGETTTSTSAPHLNRQMTTEITWEPANPVAGDVVTVTVVWTDPDAQPNTNCSRVTGDDGISFTDADCLDEVCPEDPTIPAQGGTRSFSFTHTFSAEGSYDITAIGRSGIPECGNPFASRGEVTATIEVELAA